MTFLIKCIERFGRNGSYLVVDAQIFGCVPHCRASALERLFHSDKPPTAIMPQLQPEEGGGLIRQEPVSIKLPGAAAVPSRMGHDSNRKGHLLPSAKLEGLPLNCGGGGGRS